MWMKYYTLLEGILDNNVNFGNPLQRFLDEKNKQYCLSFSAHNFIPTSKIIW